jgi:hypothetical protein
LDGSSAYDPDGGGIARYDWDFGDGATATDGGPIINHTYAEAGSWTVALTVTDDEGETDSQAQIVSAGQPATINLTVVGYKLRAIQYVDLSWDSVDTVDIFRDGNYLDTRSIITDGPYTDDLGVKRGGPYAYQVCAAGTIVCSAVVTVEF